MYAYVGSLTRLGRGDGISVWELDERDGAMSAIERVAVPDPSHLVVSKRGRLYAASHVHAFEGHPGGALVAFAIDRRSGRLARLNHQPAPPHPAYVALDRLERCVLTACTFGGAVAVFPLAEDGRLAPASAVAHHPGSRVIPDPGVGDFPPVPDGAPLPHCVVADARDRHLLVPDARLDRIAVYPFDARRGSLGKPAWHAAVAGAGPRHLALHPDGSTAYVANEKASTVTVLSYDGTAGALVERQSLPMLPTGSATSSLAADIQVHPSGRFVYATNRGHDSIAWYRVDDRSHGLAFAGCEPCGGRTPRHLAFSPDGRLLLVANQGSDAIVAFRVDAHDGRPYRTGAVTRVGTPTCVAVAA